MGPSIRKLVYAVAGTSVAFLPLVACSSNSSTSGDSGPGFPEGGSADQYTPPTHDSGHDGGHKAEAGHKEDAGHPMEASSGGDASDGGQEATSHEAGPTEGGVHDGETADGHHDGETADAHHDGETDAHHDAEHDGGAPTPVLNYFMGRWDTSNVTANNAASGIGSVAAWPGSGVITTFTGINFGITLTETCGIGVTPYNAPTPGCDTVSVYLDGAPVTVAVLNGTTTDMTAANPSFTLASGSNTIQLNSVNNPSITTGTHTMAIYKNTDAFYGGTIEFGGFTTATLGTNPKESYPFTHHIEWIGDDITAGAGDNSAAVASGDSTPQDCPEEAQSSNENFSYAAVVSRHFNAERQNISESNVGASLSDPPSNMGGPPLMLGLYGQLLPNESASTYDASDYPADLVVVNMGSYGDFPNFAASPTMAQITAFEQSFEDILSQVRLNHAHAFILVVAGPGYGGALTPGEAQGYDQAVVTYQLAHGETSSTMAFYAAPTATIFACQFRPAVTDQAALATSVEAEIHTLLNW